MGPAVQAYRRNECEWEWPRGKVPLRKDLSWEGFELATSRIPTLPLLIGSPLSDSSPGAPGSVGGNIPLRGYWPGASRQGSGEESYCVSPRKIYSPSE